MNSMQQLGSLIAKLTRHPGSNQMASPSALSMLSSQWAKYPADFPRGSKVHGRKASRLLFLSIISLTVDQQATLDTVRIPAGNEWIMTTSTGLRAGFVQSITAWLSGRSVWAGENPPDAAIKAHRRFDIILLLVEYEDILNHTIERERKVARIKRAERSER